MLKFIIDKVLSCQNPKSWLGALEKGLDIYPNAFKGFFTHETKDILQEVHRCIVAVNAELDKMPQQSALVLHGASPAPTAGVPAAGAGCSAGAPAGPGDS